MHWQKLVLPYSRFYCWIVGTSSSVVHYQISTLRPEKGTPSKVTSSTMPISRTRHDIRDINKYEKCHQIELGWIKAHDHIPCSHAGVCDIPVIIILATDKILHYYQYKVHLILHQYKVHQVPGMVMST